MVKSAYNYAGHIVTASLVEYFRIANLTTVNNMSFIDGPMNCTLTQEHWKFSIAITFGSFAAFLSYSLITCLVLKPVECSSSGWCTKHKKAFNNGTLCPFDDDNDESNIKWKETCIFYINYIVLHILFIGSFISSVVYADSAYNQDNCWINILNFVRIVLHLFTQFCAIQSCFIFSKVVYKVTNGLEKLTTKMDEANFKTVQNDAAEDDPELQNLLLSSESDKIDKGRYYWLQKIDQKYIDDVKPTLDLFGHWFVVHWFSYALTTVLLSAVIVQVVIDIVGYNIGSVNSLIPDTDVETN